MPFRLDIDQKDFDRIAEGYHAMAGRSSDLRPLGFTVRDRWLESEDRLFARGFKPRSASTRLRDRYPVRGFGGAGVRADPGGRSLFLTGHLERTLTDRASSGQLDQVRTAPGAIYLQLGLKARGDAAYGFYQAKYGRDPLSLDSRAVDDSTGDVVDYLLGSHERRI